MTFDDPSIKAIPDEFGHNMAAGDQQPIKPIVMNPINSAGRIARETAPPKALAVNLTGVMYQTPNPDQSMPPNIPPPVCNPKTSNCNTTLEKFETFAEGGPSVLINSDKKFFEYTRLSNQLASDIYPCFE